MNEPLGVDFIKYIGLSLRERQTRAWFLLLTKSWYHRPRLPCANLHTVKWHIPCMRTESELCGTAISDPRYRRFAIRPKWPTIISSFTRHSPLSAFAQNKQRGGRGSTPQSIITRAPLPVSSLSCHPPSSRASFNKLALKKEIN